MASLFFLRVLLSMTLELYRGTCKSGLWLGGPYSKNVISFLRRSLALNISSLSAQASIRMSWFCEINKGSDRSLIKVLRASHRPFEKQLRKQCALHDILLPYFIAISLGKWGLKGAFFDFESLVLFAVVSFIFWNGWVFLQFFSHLPSA